MNKTLARVGSQLDNLSATARYDTHIGIFSALDLKREPLAIRRPSRKAHEFFVEGQLLRLPARDGRSPNVDRAALPGIDRDLFAIGRQSEKLHIFWDLHQKFVLPGFQIGDPESVFPFPMR